MKQDLEGKVVTKDKLKITVQPKTKKELEDIIKKTIEEKGDSCDLNFIDTSLITDMSELFLRSSFNGNISKWDTSTQKAKQRSSRCCGSFKRTIK